jgi:hypothetical protein
MFGLSDKSDYSSISNCYTNIINPICALREFYSRIWCMILRYEYSLVKSLPLAKLKKIRSTLLIKSTKFFKILWILCQK